tara:strand:+ start:4441 stop:5055 length:615 start_codon:yes stop_codon:yes gene_type:complete
MVAKLSKGQKAVLQGTQNTQSNAWCIGVSWQFKPESLLQKLPDHQTLDVSLGLFDENKRLIDCVYYGKLGSKCGAITHVQGYWVDQNNQNMKLDQGVLQFDLTKLPAQAVQAAFILSSYEGYRLQGLNSIQARVYEPASHTAHKDFIQFDTSLDESFQDSASIIMARMYRIDKKWMFEPLIKPIAQAKVNQVFDHFASSYFYSS